MSALTIPGITDVPGLCAAVRAAIAIENDDYPDGDIPDDAADATSAAMLRVAEARCRTVSDAEAKASLLVWLLVNEDERGCKWSAGEEEEAILRGLQRDLCELAGS